MPEFDFIKMHGQGNDYVYFKDLPINLDFSDLAIKTSDRHFGIGSDGIVVINSTPNADVEMRMWNNDGSEAEMCGTALRSVCYLIFKNTGKKEMSVLTKSGLKKGIIEEDLSVTVNMGTPSVLSEKVELLIDSIPFQGAYISMGNPHFVIYDHSLSIDQINYYGSKLEMHSFFKDRANIEFVQIISKNEINVMVWERGSGITLACGTGASASAYFGMKLFNLDNDIKVQLPGGFVRVFLDKDEQLYLNGNIKITCEGKYYYS